jgi:threonine/homoserine/homoserine lactone efflux protein
MALFWATFVISFLGSIHPGQVNMAVLHTTLKRHFGAGLWVAVGGALPEIIYGWLAVTGVLFFEQNPLIYKMLRWAIIPILAGLGVLTILQKEKKERAFADLSELSNYRWQYFGKGLGLGLLNPQLLPFWTVMALHFQSYPMLRISTWGHRLLFVAGASLGAWVLLALYAWVAHRQQVFLLHHFRGKRLDWAIGLSFIAMALFELVRLWLQ